MKLGVACFLGVLVAAPLAAQAAESPAQFSVTLRATIVDTYTYAYSQSDGECTTSRRGSGGRTLSLRSIRPTRIQVIAGPQRLVYRPALLVVRRSGTNNSGSYEEARRCRADPNEQIVHADCFRGRNLANRRIALRFFRPRENRVAFRSAPRPAARVCGLNRFPLPGAWLDLARGSIDEEALLNGRSLHVIAHGTASRHGDVPGMSALNLTHSAEVSWTLTFRRL
jgi:hypothetical protein